MARRPPPQRLIGSGLIPQSYQDQYNAAQGDYENTIAGLGRDEQSLFRDYGFTGGINDQGGVNFQVDPRANYGQYQSFIRGLGNQLQQARGQRMGRGLGKKGLARARENLIRFLAEGDRASMVSNLTKQASGIFGARGQARNARDRMFGQLEGGALDWWNQYGPEDPDPATTPAGFAGPDAMPGFNVGGAMGGSVGSTPIRLSDATAAAAGVSPDIPSLDQFHQGLAPDPFSVEPSYQPQPGQTSYFNPEAAPNYQAPAPLYYPQQPQEPVPMVYDPYVVPPVVKRQTAYAQ